jgi:hypothetical protein
MRRCGLGAFSIALWAAVTIAAGLLILAAIALPG